MQIQDDWQNPGKLYVMGGYTEANSTKTHPIRVKNCLLMDKDQILPL